MKTTIAAQKPPPHLSRETAAWWIEVLAEYDFEGHHIKLLQKACEAWDRSETARKAILKFGLTFDDRFGSPHARPEIAIERDSRLAFARLVREIGMDVSTLNESRPNSLPANRE